MLYGRQLVIHFEPTHRVCQVKIDRSLAAKEMLAAFARGQAPKRQLQALQLAWAQRATRFSQCALEQWPDIQRRPGQQSGFTAVSPLAGTKQIALKCAACGQRKEIINRWREGGALIPQILAYWRSNGITLFSLARVCVVAYSMRAMSGLKVLSELTQWPGSRILLSGRADEQLAVSTFNSGLTQQFIPKQSPEIRLRLTDAIQNLLHKPDPRYEHTWRATLSREQSALLNNPAISEALEKLAAQQN